MRNETLKKTILILYGWGGSARSWNQIQKILENNEYNVIIPDFPGFNDTPAPAEPWSVSDYADFIFRFIQSQGLEKFYLLGHSFGGRVAIKFAVKYPEKLKGIIFVSSAGIKPKKTFLRKLIFILAKFGNNFSFLPGYSFARKIFYKFIVRKKDYFKAKGIMKEIFKKVIEEDLIPYLSQISIPALIVWGEKDKMTPLSDGYKMNREIKNSELKIIPDVGHAPHLEAPEKLSETILNFLKKI